MELDVYGREGKDVGENKLRNYIFQFGWEGTNWGYKVARSYASWVELTGQWYLSAGDFEIELCLSAVK